MAPMASFPIPGSRWGGGPGGMENSRRDSGNTWGRGEGDSQVHEEKAGQDDGEDSREVEEDPQGNVQVPRVAWSLLNKSCSCI